MSLTPLREERQRASAASVRQRREATIAEWREAVRYDALTGEFTWLIRASARMLAGSKAGTVGKNGRVYIGFRNGYYIAHRVAWALQTGEWPPRLVDHIDCDPQNNRWTNLRLATSSQNHANQRARATTKSGYKGVYPAKTAGKWLAVVKIDKRLKHLGTFDSLEAAAAARKLAATTAYGQFAREERCA